MMGHSHWYYFLTGVMGFVAKVWVPQKSLFSLFLHAVGISRLLTPPNDVFIQYEGIGKTILHSKSFDKLSEGRSV